MHNRYTIKELREYSNKQLILAIIRERQNDCTNPYAPLSERLERLTKWVEKNLSDKEI
jgi:hypothetical protein